jgi:hypothetical protein
MMVKISSRATAMQLANAEKKLHPMIKIVKEESEVPVRHHLKDDEICLTRCPEAVGHNGFDASWGILTKFVLDADGAGLSEQLGAITTNVVNLLAYATKQGTTLTVVRAVMVFDVGVSSLKIAYLVDCVDVSVLAVGLKPDDLFWSKDKKKPTLTIVHQRVG